MRTKRRLWFAWLAGPVLGLLWGIEAYPQDPTQWQEAMRAFATEDAASPPLTHAIVFTGSSSIVMWKTLHEDMAPLTVINRGFGGSTMSDAVYWLDPLVVKYRPRAVVLYEGDNDIGQYEHTAEQVLEGFTTFFSRLHAELPEARVYFLAIKPSLLRWGVWPKMRRANDLIRVFCETQPKLRFIDVAIPMLDGEGRPRADLFEVDGLHLNAKGYALWTSVVRPALLSREEGDEPPPESVAPATGIPAVHAIVGHVSESQTP